MKKKKSSSAAGSNYFPEREKIRKQTAYGSPRAWAGFVLILLGVLQIVSAVVAAMTMRLDLALAALVGGAFTLLAHVLIGAVFDIADSSLAARRDEAARIAREALAEARRREAAFQDMQGE
jgi:hypothetical protein